MQRKGSILSTKQKLNKISLNQESNFQLAPQMTGRETLKNENKMMEIPDGVTDDDLLYGSESRAGLAVPFNLNYPKANIIK
jgi:hypothetical protein